MSASARRVPWSAHSLYVQQGRREHTAFAYDARWLANPDHFAISPDLQLMPGHQIRKAASAQDSPFPFAIADTAPDAWGRRVIARDHARRRKGNTALAALTEMDYLLAVDDFSRVGALRLREARAIALLPDHRGRAAQHAAAGGATAHVRSQSGGRKRAGESSRTCAISRARAPPSVACDRSAR